MVDQRDVGLQMDLRLAIGAHAAQYRPKLVVPEGQRGDQGVQRGLARLDLVGARGIEREIGRAVLQHHAGTAGHDGGAETAIERMDQRDRIAVLVDHGDVDRVAGETPVGRDLVPGQGARRVHQNAAFVGILLGDQPRHRHVGETRVGKMAVAYPEQLRDILRRGHTLGTHSWSHPMSLPRLKGSQGRDQIEAGFAAVAPLDGFHLSNEHLDELGLGKVKGAPETFYVEGFVRLLERVRRDPGSTILWPGFDRATM